MSETSNPFAGRPRVFRDPVHGDLAFPRELGKVITKLIDTPAFQRLRHIRQNGVTNLVFHGAEHSRFSHSLGVAWTALRMLEAIQRNSGIELTLEQHDDTVLAALLHDIGHGPFSHTLEDVLRELGVSFDHEHMTKRLLLEPEPGLCEVLGAQRSSRLVEFIDKKRRTTTHWWHGIVSSQLDADRLDYVRRDATMAGIDNHRPDIERLIENLGTFEDRIIAAHRAFDVVESYLLALDHMYESVYFHRAARAAAVLLSATLRRAKAILDMAIPDEGDPVRAILDKGQEVGLDSYVRATDASIWVHIERWQRSADPTLAYLSTCLCTRSLPRALAYPDRDIRKGTRLVENAKEITRNVFPNLEVDFLVTIDEPSRVNYKRYVANEGADNSIQTLRDGGKTVAIEDDERSIVSKVAKKFYKNRIFVPPEVRDRLSEYADRGF